MQIIGCRRRAYDYDAFGNEKDLDALDTNPFRYCGEYLDAETGSYYLRARYYDPTIGRFTQQDTHWNTANMIYGDNPQKINEREDKLGLKTYSYVPQVSAVMQSGNLYVYGLSNPIAYHDSTGEIAFLVITGIAGAIAGGIIGTLISVQNGDEWWEGALAGIAIGGIVGVAAGGIASVIASSAMGGVSLTLSASQIFSGFSALVKGGTAATLWGVSRDGVNQGIRHFFEYATEKPNRLSNIAKNLGYQAFDLSKKGFEAFTNAAMNIVNNYSKLGGLMRTLGLKTAYYYNNVIVITYNGKLQSVMIGDLKYFQHLK